MCFMFNPKMIITFTAFNVSINLLMHMHLLFSVNLLVMIFQNKVENPTAIDKFKIEVAEGTSYEGAYDHCQDIIQRSCLEDPFLCG